MSGKRGAPFGNQFRKSSQRLITLRSIASLEGVSHASLLERLKRKKVTLTQYVANLVRSHGKSFEMKVALRGCSGKREERMVSAEKILWDALVEIYEQNPELKSKRGKYNKLKEENSLNQDFQD